MSRQDKDTDDGVGILKEIKVSPVQALNKCAAKDTAEFPAYRKHGALRCAEVAAYWNYQFAKRGVGFARSQKPDRQGEEAECHTEQGVPFAGSPHGSREVDRRKNPKTHTI